MAQLILAAWIALALAPAQPAGRSMALEHLREAERLLNSVPQDTLNKKAQKKITDLRTHFAALVSAYQANGESFVPPEANWKLLFSDVESDLTGILGPAVGELGIKDLDPQLRRQLEQVRLEVELFFAAATMNLESDEKR